MAMEEGTSHAYIDVDFIGNFEAISAALKTRF